MKPEQLAALLETHMCECGPDPAHCEADAGPYPCDAAQLLTALADARLEIAWLKKAIRQHDSYVHAKGVCVMTFEVAMREVENG